MEKFCLRSRVRCEGFEKSRHVCAACLGEDGMPVVGTPFLVFSLKMLITLHSEEPWTLLSRRHPDPFCCPEEWAEWEQERYGMEEVHKQASGMIFPVCVVFGGGGDCSPAASAATFICTKVWKKWIRNYLLFLNEKTAFLKVLPWSI